MNTSYNLFELTTQDKDDLLNPDLGAIVVKPEATPRTLMLYDIMLMSNRFTVAKSDTLESNYSYQCLPMKKDTAWDIFSKVLANTLNNTLPKELGLEESIIFDDLYLTSYPKAPNAGAIGVGPHMDTNCKGIVATLVLTGELPFYICKAKSRAGSIHIPVQVDELLLMRADKCGGLPRPIHYVGEVKSDEVIQFGLRQYIDPDWKNKKDK